MYVLGIVGGVASGKSTVARAFAQRGAAILDADQVGHEVLREPEVVAAFRQRWGADVIGDDGQIVRQEVARRVFGVGESVAREREFLNSISHPRIAERLSSRIDALRRQGIRLVVIDAALLFESGWNRLCNGVVFVDAPQTDRRERALARGWTAEQFVAREASQWPVDQKRALAHWVIDNSGPLNLLSTQVDHVMAAIALTKP
jgi:dephospho-CoA kinase